MATDEAEEKPGILTRISSFIANLLETAFYHLGWYIGMYPVITILIVVLFSAACGGGFYYFEDISNDQFLWVPDDSRAIDDKQAVDEHFSSLLRFQKYIITDDNVLTPSVVRALSALDHEIRNIEDYEGKGWEQLCSRIGPHCRRNGLLEVWAFDQARINSLTQETLLHDVNTITESPVYNSRFDITQYISGIERDGDGDIVSAKAASMTWALQFNDTEDKTDSGRTLNFYAEKWEDHFLDIGERGHEDIGSIYYLAGRSREDEGGGAIQDDIQLLSAGYMIVIIFVILGMSKLNALEHRIYQSLAGIVSIGLAILISYGISSLAGWGYTPLHSILPFLMLGIGVDDMYVIVQSWDNLPKSDKLDPLHERIARMMKHAGVSITITSATDVLAFGIGGTTSLPALRSFCIYCCVGITALYLLQATFFVAVHTLNQRRLEAKRNSCIPCYTHGPDYKPNQCSQREFVKVVFEKYIVTILSNNIAKVFVGLISALLIAGGIYGTLKLEQDFDPVWFIPSDSYAADYYETEDEYFPSDGYPAAMYIGEINYYQSRDLLHQLYLDVAGNYGVNNKTLYSWSEDFDDWMASTSNPAATVLIDDGTHYPRNERDYYTLLDMFLASEGSRYMSDISFEQRNSDMYIALSRYPLIHYSFDSTKKNIKAMDSLISECDDTELTQRQCFPYGPAYLGHEGDRAIQNELYRNLGLAFLAVVLLSVVLIAHIGTSALVSICVILTVIDVGGLMYFWGLTIDTVTTILLIIAIGLAIDYAAHIGHTWMTVVGSRRERMCKTLTQMGPAVFYGGFSTFLAFVLLAASTSYVFRTFFKLFFGVVIFGLWHGLFLLPVVLSLIGPAPYLSARKSEKDEKAQEFGHDNRVFDAGEQAPPGGYIPPTTDKTYAPEDIAIPNNDSNGLQGTGTYFDVNNYMNNRVPSSAFGAQNPYWSQNTHAAASRSPYPPHQRSLPSHQSPYQSHQSPYSSHAMYNTHSHNHPSLGYWNGVTYPQSLPVITQGRMPHPPYTHSSYNRIYNHGNNYSPYFQTNTHNSGWQNPYSKAKVYYN